VRQGDVGKTNLTAKAFDTGYHFMLVEFSKDTLYFQVISDQGQTVDSGALPRSATRTRRNSRRRHHRPVSDTCLTPVRHVSDTF